MAVAAAHVGDVDAGFELRHHAVERRQPLRHEAGAVAVAVERGHAAGKPPVMLAPGHAAAGAKRLERPCPRRAHIEAGTFHACGMKTGLSSSASTSACSGESS